MNYLYNIFLELCKNLVIRVAIYINIICLAIIGSYNVGTIIGKTFNLLFS